MTLAIVILNWNGRELLETYLPSVVTNSREHSIYIIDNNSKKWIPRDDDAFRSPFIVNLEFSGSAFQLIYENDVLS